MMILDNVIGIRHIIVCDHCGLEGKTDEECMFLKIENWFKHVEETNHKKASHTVSIVGNDFEIVHNIVG